MPEADKLGPFPLYWKWIATFECQVEWICIVYKIGLSVVQALPLGVMGRS